MNRGSRRWGLCRFISKSPAMLFQRWFAGWRERCLPAGRNMYHPTSCIGHDRVNWWLSSFLVGLALWLARFLVPLFFVMALYAFGNWAYITFLNPSEVTDLANINNLFFDEFFTVLILVDVLLLLFSFTHTDKFNKVIRNSGFVISTILVKLSFGTEGLLNSVLIVTAVGFGVLILWIHMMFEKNKIPTNY